MAVKFAILTFRKNLSNLTIHIQMDNKVVLSYLLKMEGTHSLELLKISKSIWRYLLSWDHNYCRIFNKLIESPSRLGVSEFQGSFGLETASKHVSEHIQRFWISNSGPLWIQTVPSLSTIRSMEA